jgi:hypothetical protein
MLGSQNKKLRKKREDALSSITGDRVNIELMAQRARPADDPLDRDLLQTVLNNIAAIETGARNADSVTELDDLIADGESQGIASAYFCPVGEIRDEGNRALDNMELWGIPTPSIRKLRENFAKSVELSPVSPYAARAALHAIFIEVDEWTDYIDEYEGTMRGYILFLFGTSVPVCDVVWPDRCRGRRQFSKCHGKDAITRREPVRGVERLWPENQKPNCSGYNRELDRRCATRLGFVASNNQRPGLRGRPRCLYSLWNCALSHH